MRRGVKKKDYENLSNANIKKVIDALAAEKPVTKKEACEILNISYNTKRLDNIIQEYLERVEYVKKRKSMNRGKPASSQEIAETVHRYLRGDSVADIARGLYRSLAFTNAIIERVGVPQRVRLKEEQLDIDYLPDECVSTSFKPGEIVWSAKYHCSAVIKEELSIGYVESKKGLANTDYEAKHMSKCYAIYVREQSEDITGGGFNAYALAYDLGKLSHLAEHGVDLGTL